MVGTRMKTHVDDRMGGEGMVGFNMVEGGFGESDRNKRGVQ